MPGSFGIGAYGIHPFLSDDVLKQARYANIKTRAGKIAYLATLGEKAPKPSIEEGIDGSPGALKHIKHFFDEKESL